MSNNWNVVAQILFLLEKREIEMDANSAYRLTYVLSIRAESVESCVYPVAWIIPLQLLLYVTESTEATCPQANAFKKLLFRSSSQVSKYLC